MDCQLVSTGRLSPRGKVDTDGNIILGRQVPTGAPARVSDTLVIKCNTPFVEIWPQVKDSIKQLSFRLKCLITMCNFGIMMVSL